MLLDIDTPLPATTDRTQYRKPVRDRGRPRKVGKWVAFDKTRPCTWPETFARVEIIAAPGAIYPHARWYCHAFGRRSGFRDFEIPVIGRVIPLEKITQWRIPDEPIA